jgi:hypothetical protein
VAGNDHVASLNAVVIHLDVSKGQARDGELPLPHFTAKSRDMG